MEVSEEGRGWQKVGTEGSVEVLCIADCSVAGHCVQCVAAPTVEEHQEWRGGSNDTGQRRWMHQGRTWNLASWPSMIAMDASAWNLALSVHGICSCSL